MKSFITAGSKRHYDDNGFLFVEDCAILKSGVFEYLGIEISNDEGIIDGVKVDPDKLYRVLIPVEELEKAKDTFKLLPIVNDHTWLGDGEEDAKEYQEGSTGENIFVQDGKLIVPMKFTGKNIIEAIENGKEELSASYTNILKKSDNPEYDFIAMDYTGNHIALVDKGRCGKDVRVSNSDINKLVNQEKNMSKKHKTKNEAILYIDGKEIDLSQFFSDKASETDENSASDNNDVINAITEILKGKVDDDIIKAVIDQLSAKSDNTGDENNNPDKEGIDNEDIEDKKDIDNTDDEDDAVKASKIENAVASKILKSIQSTEEAKRKAYNSAKLICGDFNPFGMSEKDIYVKALNSANIVLSGKENISELRAMLKVVSTTKVDNSFNYSDTSSDKEEIELNI